MGSRICAVLILAACSKDNGDSNPGSTDDSNTGEGGADPAQECDYGMRFEGPDPPHVGDDWELWMTCDGIDTSVMIIRIYPGELAKIDGRMMTFVAPGDGKIRMQTGAHRATMDVTIIP